MEAHAAQLAYAQIAFVAANVTDNTDGHIGFCAPREKPYGSGVADPRIINQQFALGALDKSGELLAGIQRANDEIGNGGYISLAQGVGLE